MGATFLESHQRRAFCGTERYAEPSVLVGKGYATESLRRILPEALELGMPFVELVTNPENLSSQRVITKNGGVLHERFVQPELHSGKDGLRYRIYL